MKMKTPPLKQNSDMFNIEYELMKAIKTLQVCAVGLNDANQAFPYEVDLKCPDGTCTADVYFGVEVMIERLIEDLDKVWRTF